MKQIRLLSILLLAIMFLSISNNLNAQNYVGSNTCQMCHNTINPNVGYNIWAEHMKTGHPYKLNTITGNQAPVFPPNTSPGVPTPPPGKNWSDFSYMIGGYGWKARFIYPNGLVYTGPDVQYNLYPIAGTSPWVAYNSGQTTKYNYNCFIRHTTGPSQVGSWTGNPADSMGTFNEAGVRCEGCHGLGSNHVANPINVSPPITGNDLKFERCGDCHQRNGKTNAIPAAGGYIQHREQYNELLATKHRLGSMPLTCSTCHDAHIPLLYPNAAGNHATTGNKLKAIKVGCETCHPNKEIVLKDGNGNPIGFKSASCTDCHMPRAKKTAVSQTIGTGYKADLTTHLIKIETSPYPRDSMFNAAGTLVKLDENGLGRVTLDFVCLPCHSTNDLNWASSYAQGIHTNGIVVGVDDKHTIITEYALSQNYPNPFNPTTKIRFDLPKTSEVTLEIYSISGEKMATLISNIMPAGQHNVTFDASSLPSGVYIYKLSADDFSSSKKMVLLK